MPTTDLVALGESMLRLSSPEALKLEQTDLLRIDIAGAESNVAIALSRLGLQTGWVSSLPNNPLGRMVANRIRAHGVDTSRVHWSEEGRVGVYYLELGRAPRPNLVIYDRSNSAFSLLDPEKVDWAYVTAARVLHITGITPGLGPRCEQLTREAIGRARQAGQTVSFDLNYRSKIWTPEAAARVLNDILPQVDLLFCGSDEARQVFQIEAPAAEMAAEIRGRFGVSVAVVSDGERGAVAHDGALHRHQCYPAESIDPIGAGDAFAAGFLYGYAYETRSVSEGSPSGAAARGLKFGLALASLKHTHRGDISWSTLNDVLELIEQRPSDWR